MYKIYVYINVHNICTYRYVEIFFIFYIEIEKFIHGEIQKRRRGNKNCY